MQTQQTTKGSRPERVRRRRWFLRLLYAAYIVILGVVGLRGYLWWRFGVQPTDLSNRTDAVRLFYPELQRRKIGEPRAGDDELQVLLLGGSVAEQVGPILQQKLGDELGQPVIVHNAGVSAHTTLDSLNKLEYLLEQKAEFDAILIYHGINDVRMNCVAADQFRNDYTHCHWYKSFKRRKKQGSISLREGAAESWDKVIGVGEPKPDHVHLGAEIKTGSTFRSNMESMVKLAEESQIPIALMSFATHFVDGYSKTKFQAEQLGYADGAYSLATEVWGKPDNVRRGLDVHNDVIRTIAANHGELTFIDMESQLTTIDLFTDVCHLSPLGIETFADAVARQLQLGQLTPK